MYKIGLNAISASKNKINSKLKNRILYKYIYLIKKNNQLIIKENKRDIKLALQKKN